MPSVAAQRSAASSASAPATLWPSEHKAYRLGALRLAVDVVSRIQGAHETGAGWSVITRQLNADAVLTAAQGGAKLYPSTVRDVGRDSGMTRHPGFGEGSLHRLGARQDACVTFTQASRLGVARAADGPRDHRKCVTTDDNER